MYMYTQPCLNVGQIQETVYMLVYMNVYAKCSSSIYMYMYMYMPRFGIGCRS